MNDLEIPSIEKLHKEKNIKENSKVDIYNIVMNKCIEKIIYTNRQTDKTYIIFEIPKILIGHHSYDMKSCILYIINKLLKHNYMIEYIEPFYLYIDWGSKHKKKKDFVNINTNMNITSKLEYQTKELLNKFPDTSKIEFVYEENTSKKKKNKKKKKKN